MPATLPCESGNLNSGEAKRGLQKRPGFTVRFSEPPACQALRSRLDAPESVPFALRRGLLSLRRVSATDKSSVDSHLAGTGISERPFARPQRRFRHHCEVNAPGLRLQFHTENCHEAVRLPTPALLDGFEAVSGRNRRRQPVFRSLFPALSRLPRHPLPFGSLEKPSGSKRSTGYTARSPSRGNIRSLPCPRRRVLFRFRRRAAH
jgi:hypothetical protein